MIGYRRFVLRVILSTGSMGNGLQGLKIKAKKDTRGYLLQGINLWLTMANVIALIQIYIINRFLCSEIEAKLSKS